MYAIEFEHVKFRPIKENPGVADAIQVLNLLHNRFNTSLTKEKGLLGTHDYVENIFKAQMKASVEVGPMVFRRVDQQFIRGSGIHRPSVS